MDEYYQNLLSYPVDSDLSNGFSTFANPIVHFFYPPKNLHRPCFRFLLGHLHVPREIEYNHYAKFWVVNTMYYGICESREYLLAPKLLRRRTNFALAPRSKRKLHNLTVVIISHLSTCLVPNFRVSSPHR